MGKTKTKSQSRSKDILRGSNATLVKSGVPSIATDDLLAEATTLLEASQPEKAQPLVTQALQRLQAARDDYKDTSTLQILAAQDKPTYPATLALAGDIALALGDSNAARSYFEEAIKTDPDGAIVSAEPWLQLAQLCEEGGKKSIAYYDKAIEIMQNEIEVLSQEDSMAMEGTEEIIELRRQKVAEALCAETEVYMTDLSWEDDAEERCEQLVTEAVATCSERLSAGVLQTLANIRISQGRVDEAVKILEHSVSIWKDLPSVEDPARPDFATRISLVRLLIEVEREADAMVVAEGLVKEDDQSVESWYLGGWCQLLLSQKDGLNTEQRSSHVEQSRAWLGNCLKLYQLQAYEDERLLQHAQELVHQLNTALGLQDDEWEDTDDEKDDVVEDDEIEEEDPAGDVEMS